MTHLLDSSALFAFVFGEPGQKRVEAFLADSSLSVGLCALSALEWWARLKAEGHEDAFEHEWETHLPMFDRVVPVSLEVSLKAIELRRAASERIPTIDSVIAACAVANGAILVHRDPHFRSIPKRFLAQESLPDRH